MEDFPQSGEMRLQGRDALLEVLRFWAGLATPPPFKIEEGAPDYDGLILKPLLDALETVLPAQDPHLRHFRCWAENVRGFASGNRRVPSDRLHITENYACWELADKYFELTANVDNGEYGCRIMWQMGKFGDLRFAPLVRLWQGYQAS